MFQLWKSITLSDILLSWFVLVQTSDSGFCLLTCFFWFKASYLPLTFVICVNKDFYGYCVTKAKYRNKLYTETDRRLIIIHTFWFQMFIFIRIDSLFSVIDLFKHNTDLICFIYGIHTRHCLKEVFHCLNIFEKVWYAGWPVLPKEYSWICLLLFISLSLV